MLAASTAQLLLANEDRDGFVSLLGLFPHRLTAKKAAANERAKAFELNGQIRRNADPQ
jgi:hypothetical protein